MKELLEHHRLGDRWIVAAGLVVASAIAALLGIAFLVAHNVDEDSARRDIALAKKREQRFATAAKGSRDNCQFP